MITLYMICTFRINCYSHYDYNNYTRNEPKYVLIVRKCLHYVVKFFLNSPWQSDCKYASVSCNWWLTFQWSWYLVVTLPTPLWSFSTPTEPVSAPSPTFQTMVEATTHKQGWPRVAAWMALQPAQPATPSPAPAPGSCPTISTSPDKSTAPGDLHKVLYC